MSNKPPGFPEVPRAATRGPLAERTSPDGVEESELGSQGEDASPNLPRRILESGRRAVKRGAPGVGAPGLSRGARRAQGERRATPARVVGGRLERREPRGERFGDRLPPAQLRPGPIGEDRLRLLPAPPDGGHARAEERPPDRPAALLDHPPELPGGAAEFDRAPLNRRRGGRLRGSAPEQEPRQGGERDPLERGARDPQLAGEIAGGVGPMVEEEPALAVSVQAPERAADGIDGLGLIPLRRQEPQRQAKGAFAARPGVAHAKQALRAQIRWRDRPGGDRGPGRRARRGDRRAGGREEEETGGGGTPRASRHFLGSSASLRLTSTDSFWSASSSARR